VTFYHPTGDSQPALRHVVDIVKLQNIIFSFDVAFATEEWDGAPMIPDEQATVNPDAKKPSMAITRIYGVIDGLALNAIIAEPEFAKSSTTAVPSSSNPKRLNLRTIVKLSGNTNIVDLALDWGFFYGVPVVVA